MIFDREPTDWADLENMVGQMFSELGCNVEVEKRVENVRGAKVIDVYVVDPVVAPAALYLCECKHLKRPVEQEIVHSFRTVLQDTGAHRGFIISNSGFQKGAFEAVKNTNLDLVTFPELQGIFFERWRISMAEHFTPYADALFPYWDYPGRMPKFQWNEAHRQRQYQLMEAYRPLQHLGPMAKMQGYQYQFPIRLPAVDAQGNISGELQIDTYRQLFDFFDANKDVALRHYQVIHGEVEPDRERGEYDPHA